MCWIDEAGAERCAEATGRRSKADEPPRSGGAGVAVAYGTGSGDPVDPGRVTQR